MPSIKSQRKRARRLRVRQEKARRGDPVIGRSRAPRQPAQTEARSGTAIGPIPAGNRPKSKSKEEKPKKMGTGAKLLMGLGALGIPFGGYNLYNYFTESEDDRLVEEMEKRRLLALLEGGSEGISPTMSGFAGLESRGVPTPDVGGVDNRLGSLLSQQDMSRLQQMGGELQQSRRQLLAEMGVLI